MELNTFDIVPTNLAVKAMRDSGYKNAAYAIAELIDNAIQAGAAKVELLCREDYDGAGKGRARIREIAVLDNGSGMSADVLRKALQFGNGTRLDDRSGIGRFGMGLPNSSMSQARRVDVWTWTAGVDSAIHSYLDLNEIEQGRLTEVPAARPDAVPHKWRAVGKTFAKTGTLVMWSEIDRCQWRTAQAIIRNSELLIGRIYRRYLDKGKASIRMVAFQDQPALALVVDEFARPNDPLYLMADTSCLAPWAQTPMFEPYGEPFEIIVKHGGRDSKVVIRFSVAKREARQGHNPGALPHGKHAQANLGVSILRADRELELQTEWTTSYDPVERWWGAEVEIDPALDEVFGVTNNKQSARALAEVATVSDEALAQREGYDSPEAMKSEWRKQDDERLILLTVKAHLIANIRVLRSQLERHNAGARAENRHRDPESAESIGTQAAANRAKAGHKGQSDVDAQKPAEARLKEIAAELEKGGKDPESAMGAAKELVETNRKFHFEHVDLESDAFFSVRPKGGVIIIQLNINHPAYEHLVALLEELPDSQNVEDFRDRMLRSYRGLKLLLEAWARFEDETTSSDRKDTMRKIRSDWGRVAAEFMEQD